MAQRSAAIAAFRMLEIDRVTVCDELRSYIRLGAEPRSVAWEAASRTVVALRAHDAIRARNAAKQLNVSTSMGRLLVRPSMTVRDGD
jgi:hypothetical protein